MTSDGFDARIIRNLEGMEKIIERAYFPGRARSLAITKLDECILWLTCAKLKSGEAPEHVTNDD